MSAHKRFRVAICGGGIGGLTLALALSRYPDIEVDIYEAATKLTEVGAGIGFWSRPWKIIRMLGLEADLLQLTEAKPGSAPVKSFRYRKSDQPHGFDFFTLITNGSLITLHRADFQGTLLKHLPRSCRTHTSKRLRTYTHRSSGSIDLFFEDGTAAQCDILVGADGFKSAVRRTLLNERAMMAQQAGRTREASEILSSIEPLWSGTNAFRALIPAEKLMARYPGHRALTTPSQFLGRDSYVMAYPIQKGKMVNFVAFISRHDLENSPFAGPWVAVVTPEHLASVFDGWEPEVQALIDCVEKPLLWSIPVVKPMRSFVSGQVAMLGDAAHAAVPHQGMGAGQAVEDAIILATALGHPRINRENIKLALRVYDEIRRPAALLAQERSRQNGKYFTFACEGTNFENMSPEQAYGRLQQLGQEITSNWEWAWSSSVDSSIQEAVRMIETF